MFHQNFSKLFLMATAAVTLSASSLLGAELRIIDTKFTDTDAEGAPLTAEIPTTESALPLTRPTSAKVEQSANDNEGSLVVSKTAIGDFTPPFLIINTGERDSNPEVSASFNLQWRLNVLKLHSGVYNLKFTTGAGQLDKGGFGIHLVVTNPHPDPDLRLHPNNYPFTVWFNKGGTFRVGGTDQKISLNYQPDEPVTFNITVDFDEKTWTVLANDRPILEKAPFPEYLNEGAWFIDAVAILCTAGVGTQPNAQYYLSNVELTQIKP